MSSPNRRSFLRSAGAAAGALGAQASGPFVTSGWAKDKPGDRINIAIMGIRARGYHGHMMQYLKIPNVRVHTLCDIDESLFPERLARAEELQGKAPETATDIRRVLEDKDIDAVSIAAPNHWHALATVWACQAGKDVYVEKPVCHDISEGRRMVAAARRHGRIVQCGTQNRSNPVVKSAIEYIRTGELGPLYMVKCVVFRYRPIIGVGQTGPVPEGVHYDLFRGPAPWRPFNENRFHYNWHWFWDTGNGEFGNNGVHYTDIARWALEEYDHPVRIQSMGGIFQEQETEQETPDTQMTVMEYADGRMVQAEVRNMTSNTDGSLAMGVLFFGTNGWMELSPFSTWATYFGQKNEPGPAFDPAADPELLRNRSTGIDPHFVNFLDCMRSRRAEDLRAGIIEGHLSSSMCCLGNIAYRVGRTVSFDSRNECFPEDDEAQALVSLSHRAPYTMKVE